jgi:flagellar export protein FliJ
MKPFRFPLQPIRVLREQKEQQAQQHYALALNACEEAAARVRAAGEELAACWTTLGDELAAGAEATEVLRTRAWCNVLELRLRERTGALEKARLDVDQVWREMLLATRDREALDRFYDKAHRIYDRDVQRAEQKELDELALARRGGSPTVFQVPPAVAAPSSKPGRPSPKARARKQEPATVG